MTPTDLEEMRAWADEKIAGDEPPWAWYQYMKLRETLDAILAGMAATKPHYPLHIVGNESHDSPEDGDAHIPTQEPM